MATEKIEALSDEAMARKCKDARDTLWRYHDNSPTMSSREVGRALSTLQWYATVELFRAQRDELLTVCKKLVRDDDAGNWGWQMSASADAARAAIAYTQEGQPDGST